jgi:hypothetical protein
MANRGSSCYFCIDSLIGKYIDKKCVSLEGKYYFKNTFLLCMSDMDLMYTLQYPGAMNHCGLK